MAQVSRDYLAKVKNALDAISLAGKIDTINDRGYGGRENTVWMPIPLTPYSPVADTAYVGTHIALAEMAGGALTLSGPDQGLFRETPDQPFRNSSTTYIYSGSQSLYSADLMKAVSQARASDASLEAFAQKVFDADQEAAITQDEFQQQLSDALNGMKFEFTARDPEPGYRVFVTRSSKVPPELFLALVLSLPVPEGARLEAFPGKSAEGSLTNRGYLCVYNGNEPDQAKMLLEQTVQDLLTDMPDRMYANIRIMTKVLKERTAHRSSGGGL